ACSPASARSPWRCAGACIGGWALRRTSCSSKRAPMCYGPAHSRASGAGVSCKHGPILVVPTPKAHADGPSSPSAATGLLTPPPLRSPSPREEALVQLVHPCIRSQVPFLATDDGEVHHIRRIVFDDNRLGVGIIIRGHQATRRPPQEETHAHAARGTRKIWSRQH